MNGPENSIALLKRALDVSHQRNRVISENLANVETPGYKAREVDFRKAMADADQNGALGLSRSNAKHIAAAGSREGVKVENSTRPAKADGNNVDQEIEIVNLSENTVIYNAASEILSRKIKLLRFAIEDGGI